MPFAPEPPRSWTRLELSNGRQLGYGWQQVTPLADGRHLSSWSVIRTREAGGKPVETIEITERDESKTGRTLSLTQTTRVGSLEARLTLSLEGDQAIIIRTTGHDRTVKTVAVPASVRFDTGSALLRTLTPTSRNVLTFDALNLKAGQIERVTLEVNPTAQARSNGAFEVIRKHWRGSDIQRIYVLSVARDGAILRTEQPRFGTDIVIIPTDQAGATTPFEPQSLVRSSMVKSPVRILPSAFSGHIRYSFAFRNGLAFRPPVTSEQQARQTDYGVAFDVCATCGSPTALSEAERADALAATSWLQVNHPLIQSMASGLPRSAKTDAEKLAILALRARARLRRIDFTGHFSAVDALKRGAGDCTEDALVLATLGRAVGIPTKVASGIVYSRERYHGVSNVFLTHNWTLAWIDGRWRSFDMSIGSFDATHIATNISDGDADSLASASLLASLLEWKSVVQVKARI